MAQFWKKTDIQTSINLHVLFTCSSACINYHLVKKYAPRSYPWSQKIIKSITCESAGIFHGIVVRVQSERSLVKNLLHVGISGSSQCAPVPKASSPHALYYIKTHYSYKFNYWYCYVPRWLVRESVPVRSNWWENSLETISLGSLPCPIKLYHVIDIIEVIQII